MKRILLLPLLLGCGSAPHDTGTVPLTGTITGLTTGTQVPLSGVTVTVADTGQQVVSATDGTFTLERVPIGFHWLHVAPTYYSAIDTQVFSVQENQTTELPPIDFEQNLTQSGALRGRVELTGTGPVMGATASIEGQSRQSVESDVNGYFVFPSIITGNYTLTVSLDHTTEGSQVLRNVLVNLDAVTDAGTVTFTPE